MESVIGLLSPLECISCGDEGSALCRTCADQLIKPFGERCWRCNRLSPSSRTCDSCRHTGSPSQIFIVTDYDGVAKELVSLYKFGHQRVAVATIARLMCDIFPKDKTSRDVLVAPVPTATSRIRERGFDHAELLSKKIAAMLKSEHAPVLRRLDQTRQLGSRRQDRLKQLNESFAVKNQRQVAGRNILLVDDVVTTGGTISAATQALRAGGAKRVDALLFAKRL